MSTPAPQTISHELFAQLEKYITAGTIPEPLVLKRIQRDAGRLASVDPIDGQQVYAMLAALQWNIGEVLERVRNTLHLKSDFATLSNAAIITGQVHQFELSLAYAKRAWEIAPQNADAAQQYITVMLRTGQLRAVANLAPTLNVSAETRAAARLDQIAQALDRLQISDEQLSVQLSIAFEAMTERKVRAPAAQFRCQYDPEDGSPSVVYCIAMHGDEEDEAALSAATAARLKDLPGWNPAEFLIDFVPAQLFTDELQFA